MSVFHRVAIHEKPPSKRCRIMSKQAMLWTSLNMGFLALKGK